MSGKKPRTNTLFKTKVNEYVCTYMFVLSVCSDCEEQLRLRTIAHITIATNDCSDCEELQGKFVKRLSIYIQGEALHGFLNRLVVIFKGAMQSA